MEPLRQWDYCRYTHWQLRPWHLKRLGEAGWELMGIASETLVFKRSAEHRLEFGRCATCMLDKVNPGAEVGGEHMGCEKERRL